MANHSFTYMAGQQRLGLDVVVKGRSYPTVALIQHGGWLQVDKRDPWMVPWIEAFYDAGFNVVGLNWRSAPEFKFPTALFDIGKALFIATRRLSALLGKDVLNFPMNLVGMSSGGHLATLYALEAARYQFRDFPGPFPYPNIKTCISIAGVYDLRTSENTGVGNGFIECFLPSQSWAPLASPLTYAPFASDKKKSFLLVHGIQDDIIPYQQAETMFSRLDEVGADVSFEGYNLDHTIGQYTSEGWEERFNSYVSFISANS